MIIYFVLIFILEAAIISIILVNIDFVVLIWDGNIAYFGRLSWTFWCWDILRELGSLKFAHLYL